MEKLLIIMAFIAAAMPLFVGVVINRKINKFEDDVDNEIKKINSRNEFQRFLTENTADKIFNLEQYLGIYFQEEEKFVEAKYLKKEDGITKTSKGINRKKS